VSEKVIYSSHYDSFARKKVSSLNKHILSILLIVILINGKKLIIGQLWEDEKVLQRKYLLKNIGNSTALERGKKE
jgi:hypothetical protein